MSTKGSAESYIKMRGSIKIPTSIVGKSAYEVAVENGFDGTVEEWLASLKSELTDEDVERIADEVAKKIAMESASARIGNVTIYADKWVGSSPLFSQVVTVDGATENSQVDLTPSVEQLAIFYEKDLTLVTENEGGVVTVYAIGQKPTNDYTIQVTITEVAG